jgi:uncharacterized protein (DUF2147 family)
MKNSFFAVILSIILSTSSSFAQDITTGSWFNEEKSAKVQFYNKDNKIFGKIIWLKEPTKAGKPRTDEFNPNSKLKETPLLGLIFLKNFKAKGNGKWEDGQIYDPKNGKTYSSEINQLNANQLNVRGYIGISLLGRTSKFTRAD